MVRRMIWLSGVMMAISAGSFAGVVEQGLTVRGRAEELLEPTCAYATVYAEERFAQTDIALKSADALSQKIIKQVSSKCEVRDVQVRTETFSAKTSILNTKNVETREHLVRQRIRFICDPKIDILAMVVYRACESSAILYGTTSTLGTEAIYPSAVTDESRTVWYGVEADEDLTRRMYEKALANAAERAKTHAEVAGKKIGKILSIQCDEFINGEVPALWAFQNGFTTGILGVGQKHVFASYEVVVTYEFVE